MILEIQIICKDGRGDVAGQFSKRLTGPSVRFTEHDEEALIIGVKLNSRSFRPFIPLPLL